MCDVLSLPRYEHIQKGTRQRKNVQFKEHRTLEGTNRLLGKKKTGRRSCKRLFPSLSRGWTHIYNYSKQPVFCLRGPLKHIFALYLETLAGKITENEKHEGRHRGETTRRKHSHNKHFESMRAISPSTSLNKKHAGSSRVWSVLHFQCASSTSQ